MTQAGRANSATDRFELKQQLVLRMLSGDITLGQMGKTLRTEGLRMSQTEVCKITGLSRQVVSDIENDNGNPRLDNLRSYFKLLGLELAVLPRQRTELDSLLKPPAEA
ncbi:helix-turn-helix domain-containing protein [Rheinheimera baltica]|uniref:helix-turn-helix domain-containing protein n=1 Tax=Rheinheimera baltica TaxID=67576 RepID=UPI000485616D|nr:helix-turn-helix transcriptional regulator [Rheinheimera baltica]